MFDFLMLLIGFILGGGVMYFYFKKIHDVVLSLDVKYNRLISLISEWQKKI